MILAEKPISDKRDDNTEWYPGKYLGMKLGLRKKNSPDLEPNGSNVEPLVWRTIEQLSTDLGQTQHIEGVNAVLEICCTIIDDNLYLVMAAMNAIIRLATGRLDRALRFGECGTCKYVVQLLHWFIYSDIDVLSPVTTEDRETFGVVIEECVMSILGAVEVLAAGCKPNRERLGQMGACSYVMEAFRRHGKNGRNLYFTELVYNCIWQLSFGNTYNRSRLREAGAENFLWRVSNSSTATPAQRSRAQAVLGWLKSQLAEDLRVITEPREIVGGLLLSISEISNSSAKGSPTEAVKLASESFLAIMRLCLRSSEENVLLRIEELTTSIFIPEKIIRVTRRILRHHKKIFREDIEKLCNFIVTSCEAICCLLSSPYRAEKIKKDEELKQALASPEGEVLENSAPQQPRSSQPVDEDELSDGFVNISPNQSISESPLLQLNRAKKEKMLRSTIAKQIAEAGACRMLVKELELYVDPSSSHYQTPAKHTHIALKTTSLLDLDPMSIISAGTGTLTRGVVAGFQGVKSGISMLGDAVQSTISKPEVFPDTPEGKCITAVTESIRILAEISLPIRINFLEENLNTTCKLLSRGPYGIGMKNLQSWFLYQLQNDLMQQWPAMERNVISKSIVDEDSDDESSLEHSLDNEIEEVDNGVLTLSLAIKILSKFGGKSSGPSSEIIQMDDIMKAIFRDAIDYIGRFISERGIQGEVLFANQNGYEALFVPMNKNLIIDFKIIDAWITTITSIGLAKIDAKMTLAQNGACEICLDAIRVHILRPRIVEKCLWCLCVLAANNSTSMSRILSWNSESWNSESAKTLLVSLQKNKGQTNETREHAGLILSWMELRQSLPKSPGTKTKDSNILTSPVMSNDDISSVSESDPGRRMSEISSPRDSLRLETDLIHSLIDLNDVFFSFSLSGHSKSGIIHEYGTTEI